MPSPRNPGGGKPDKVIRDALKAALRQDPERLKRVAEKAWAMAEEGNLAALKEIADRLDGKAVQPISNDGDDAFEVLHRIERVIVDPANKDS